MTKYIDDKGLKRFAGNVDDQINNARYSVLNTKGKANGIASLDSKGFVPLDQLGNLDMTFFEPVQELPTEDIKKHIYLIKNNKEGEQDTYDEYLYTGDVDGEYDASKWEKLGDFVPTFDLKEYAKKKDAVNSISIRDIIASTDAPDNFELGLYYTNGDGEEKCVIIPTVTVGGVIERPDGYSIGYAGHNGLMSSDDKYKLDQIDTEALSQSISNANTAADNADTAANRANAAADGAEKVDASLSEDNILSITGRNGTIKTISLASGEEALKNVKELSERVDSYHGSYAEFMFNDDTRIIVDGKNIAIAARVKTRVYPKKSLIVGDRYSKKTLIYADVANLDTSGFTSFSTMFANCNILSELNLSAWDTSQVTSMAYMFNGCSSLTSLNLSAWDTSQVTSMASMFNGCSSLTSLNLSAWDTSQVTSMASMFANCNILSELNLSAWDTSQVTSMASMFNGCSSLTSLNLSAWDTSQVTSMASMFANCNILSELNLSAWDTSQVTSMASMFANCNILSELNLSAWDTSQVTSMASMFNGCSSLTSLNLSAWDTTSLGKGEKESRYDTGIHIMFYGSYNIKKLDMGGDGWNFVNIPSSNSFYRPLESSVLTEWKLGKNFFKGRFVNQYYNSNAFNNWSKASFIESIVTNSYDRRANGYDDVTLYFNAKLKGYLSEEDIATMTAKGYIIA